MDRIVVHFLHGFVPKSQYKNTEPTIRGGLWGGHIFIQIKHLIYGFETFHDDDFHIFPRMDYRKFNSMLKKERLTDWQKNAHNNKFTSFEIPLTNPRFIYLRNVLKQYRKKPPFDYALFGMRCTSFTHYILTKAKVCHSRGFIDSVIRYPYPRKLRKKLMRKALRNGWRITQTPGTDHRIWENDVFPAKYR